MKLHVLSDLHLEHHKCNVSELINIQNADAVVLAGDITNLVNIYSLEDTLKYFSDSYKYVFYVPGNHEFYLDFDTALTNFFKLKLPSNVYTSLYGSQYVIEDRIFFLGTMGFNINPITKNIYENYISDNLYIPYSFWERVELIWNCKLSLIKKSEIIITHFLPSFLSCEGKFSGSPLNPYFVRDCEYLIEKQKLWIHGHTHESKNYYIRRCRVLSNPFGYPGEKRYFDVVVEV